MLRCIARGLCGTYTACGHSLMPCSCLAQIGRAPVPTVVVGAGSQPQAGGYKSMCIRIMLTEADIYAVFRRARTCLHCLWVGRVHYYQGESGMKKHLITAFLLVIAIVLYAVGLALPATFVVLLGVLVEGAFWMRLFNISRGSSKL